jgi:FMN phosphatase YigB (HAD superfamily)
VNVRAVIFDLGHTLWDIEFATEALPSLYDDIRGRLARALAGVVPEAAQLREAVEQRFLQDHIAYLTEGKLTQSPTQQLVGEGLGRLGLVLSPDLLAEITAIIVD